MLQLAENKTQTESELEKFSDQAILAEFERRFPDRKPAGRKLGKPNERYHCRHCQENFTASGWRQHSRTACKLRQNTHSERSGAAVKGVEVDV